MKTNFLWHPYFTRLIRAIYPMRVSLNTRIIFFPSSVPEVVNEVTVDCILELSSFEFLWVCKKWILRNENACRFVDSSTYRVSRISISMKVYGHINTILIIFTEFTFQINILIHHGCCCWR